MGDRHYSLTKSSKWSEYRTVRSIWGSLLEHGVNCICPKALNGVSLEVWSTYMILQVLVMANATPLGLASLGGTLEEMKLLAIIGINLDVTLEETVDRWSPGFLQTFCNANISTWIRRSSNPQNVLNSSLGVSSTGWVLSSSSESTTEVCLVEFLPLTKIHLSAGVGKQENNRWAPESPAAYVPEPEEVHTFRMDVQWPWLHFWQLFWMISWPSSWPAWCSRLWR